MGLGRNRGACGRGRLGAASRQPRRHLRLGRGLGQAAGGRRGRARGRPRTGGPRRGGHASGGVGRFAVQLAARAGAYVIASAGSPERAEGLTGLGACQVVTGLAGVEAPLHGILDNVAGPQLASAFALLAPGAVAEWIGTASGQPIPLETTHKMSQGRLNAFFLGDHLGEDLAYLLDLLDNGDLDPQIGWRSRWENAPAAAEALLARRINGKVVLDLTLRIQSHHARCGGVAPRGRPGPDNGAPGK